MYTHAYTSRKTKRNETNNWTVSNELNEIIEPIQKHTQQIWTTLQSKPIQIYSMYVYQAFTLAKCYKYTMFFCKQLHDYCTILHHTMAAVSSFFRFGFNLESILNWCDRRSFCFESLFLLRRLSKCTHQFVFLFFQTWNWMLHTFGSYQIKYKSLNTQVTNVINEKKRHTLAPIR